jgi:hypothetical protein
MLISGLPIYVVCLSHQNLFDSRILTKDRVLGAIINMKYF